MWLTALISLFLAAAGALIYGSFRWKAETHSMRAKLRALSSAAPPLSQDLESLPEPVRRFLRVALPLNPPTVTAAKFSHSGTFNLSETMEKWVPFTSGQLVITNPPGFDWDARITMAPGMNAFVHDAYVDGAGTLAVKAFGLIPMVNIHGTPEIAQGELQRFLAESAWYPTSLFPRPGLRWDPVDAHSATATLHDGVNTAALTFHFSPRGLIDKVTAAARFRIVDGVASATPWECLVWDYELHDGMQIPTSGEVAWVLPDRRLPYWRARLTAIQFDFNSACPNQRAGAVAA